MTAQRPARAPGALSALLVANTGGHLRELHELRPRFGLSKATWFTFDDTQSRSLLSGEVVHHLEWTGSRDYANTVRNLRPVVAHLRRHRYDAVISTGAAVALSVLPVARALGVSCHYVESATRTVGPSLTGRVLSLTPGVHRYTQYESWAGSRWRYSGSVFDGFAATRRTTTPSLGKVVVTLGTMKQWSFRAAVERLVAVLPRDTDVVWQTGHTDVSGLPIVAQPFLPSAALAAHMAQADVVVAHAGVGSSLDALSAGRSPVLIPRRAARAEHVDDHQEWVARELLRRGLATVAEAPELTIAHLEQAASQAVARITPPDFPLVGRRARARG